MKILNSVNIEVADLVAKTPIGKKVTVEFAGAAVPIDIMMKFAGGWEIGYTLIPGMPLEFTKGEDGYLQELHITILPHEGLKQQD